MRVRILTAGLALAAVLLYVLWVRELTALDSPISIPWWALAVAFGVCEAFVVSIQFRREAHSFSMSDLPLVLGLFFTPPGLLVPAHVLGASLALILHAKQVSLKLFFNLAQMALQSCVAVVVFHAIVSHGSPIGPTGWLGAGAAMFLTNLMSDLAITAAISVMEGRLQPLPNIIGFGTAISLANLSLALTAVVVLWSHPEAAWMVVVLCVIIFLAYQSHASLSAEHERLELLYEATRAAQGSLEVGEITRVLLAHVKEMFRSEIAELTMFAPGGKQAITTALDAEDCIEVSGPVDLKPTEGVWARVVSEGQAVLLPRPIASERLKRYFAARNMRDAMVAPLHGKGDVMGTLVVGNRLGEVRSYNESDLKLFEMVVNHAGVSLENGRLVAELRREAEEREHQALHDPLTGLPNRSLLHQRLARAIEEISGSDARAAVLLMDLDRFKEVNDALGHHIGDVLLQEIAARLQETVGDGETVARLGGDEFAIVAPRVQGVAAAADSAARALTALRDPFSLEGLTVEVEGSIGIAVFPEHGGDPTVLIQRADVAMYHAKHFHSGFEFYASELDEYSPSRLALVDDLRVGIERGELEVHYQAKADLVSGEVTGVEALVRWNHPVLGLVRPDEFIPLAEQTGLIKRLTPFVLDTALGQVHRWAEDGLDLGVAVNLSTRNLLDLELPNEVAGLLGKWNVSARLLELEITESMLMTDPVRVDSVLSELSSMGVQISIDDFGTGYSSLSYLKKLPVDEIKIDKSFVLGMSENENDAIIVRSTIELGRNLGLRVVAEGVESEEDWDRLGVFGCDMVQGFWLSRPLPADAFETWVRARGSTDRAAARV